MGILTEPNAVAIVSPPEETVQSIAFFSETPDRVSADINLIKSLLNNTLYNSRASVGEYLRALRQGDLKFADISVSKKLERRSSTGAAYVSRLAAIDSMKVHESNYFKTKAKIEKLSGTEIKLVKKINKLAKTIDKPGYKEEAKDKEKLRLLHAQLGLIRSEIKSTQTRLKSLRPKVTEERKEVLFEVSKLACLNFLPEAQVWAQRGATTAAKAKLGRGSAQEHYANAEAYYVKAFYHYRDLRDKFMSLATVNGSQAKTELEVAELGRLMQEIKPKIYEMRIKKQTAALFASLKGNFNAEKCLEAMVSLSRAIVESRPMPKRRKDGQKMEINHYVSLCLEETIKDSLIEIADIQQCMPYFTAMSQVGFKNVLSTLYWHGSHTITMPKTQPDLLQDIIEDYAAEMESAIDSLRKDINADEFFTKEPLLERLKSKYLSLVAEHKAQIGDLYSQLDDTTKLKLLEKAKLTLVSEIGSDTYLVEYTRTTTKLWQSLCSVRQGIFAGMQAVAESAGLSPNQVTSLQSDVAAAEEISNDEFLWEESDLEKLTPVSLDATHSVVRDIMTGKLWSPYVHYSPSVVNPRDVDVRPEVYDLDVITDLAIHQQSRYAVSAS